MPTGQGTPIVVRIHGDLMERLDDWIAKQHDLKLSRPEAIRRMLRDTLASFDGKN